MTEKIVADSRPRAEKIVVNSDKIQVIAVQKQGPPGPPGEHGFTTSVDVIDGGTAFTDYTNGFIFDGGEA